MTADQPAPTLRVLEVAQRLDVQPSVVRRWIAEGRLRATRSGKSYRVAVSEVERMKGSSHGARRSLRLCSFAPGADPE